MATANGMKTGGRKKGTPNKRASDALEIMRAADYDPIEEMMKIAQDEDTSQDMRASMHRELAQYAYPKRKAIEVSGPQGEPVAFKMVISAA